MRARLQTFLTSHSGSTTTQTSQIIWKKKNDFFQVGVQSWFLSQIGPQNSVWVLWIWPNSTKNGLKVTFCHRWCRCNLGLIRDVSDGQSLAKEPFTRSWTIGGVLWQEAADAMLLSWQKITVVIKSWDQ